MCGVTHAALAASWSGRITGSCLRYTNLKWVQRSFVLLRVKGERSEQGKEQVLGSRRMKKQLRIGDCT